MLDDESTNHAVVLLPPRRDRPAQDGQQKSKHGSDQHLLLALNVLQIVPAQRLDMDAVVAGGPEPEQHFHRLRGRGQDQVLVERSVLGLPDVLPVTGQLGGLAGQARIEQRDLIEVARQDAQHQTALPVWVRAL